MRCSAEKGCIEMKFNQNEEAVSPVIGVILMVAITVILAAVIAVFVFGMADDIQSSHTVAATSKMVNSTAVMVTYQGGNDAQDLMFINGSVLPSNEVGTIVNTNDATKPVPVGSSMTITVDPATSKQLMVTGTFKDGTTQVLIDKLL